MPRGADVAPLPWGWGLPGGLCQPHGGTGCRQGVPKHSLPSRPNIEVGWSPLPDDPSPYFQVDLLQPTFVSAVVTQGGTRSGGFITRYRLAYSYDGVHYRDYAPRGGPAQVPSPLPQPSHPVPYRWPSPFSTRPLV